MRYVERLLAQDHIKPQRPLSKEFTNNIINHIDKYPRKTRWFSIKEVFTMKQLTKPAFAISAVLTIITVSGTAYAAVGGWPGIQAILGGQQKLHDARVVKVDTKNCAAANAFTIATKTKEDAFYYKVKDNSKLTNDQIVQMVHGFCELDRSGQATLDYMPELDKNPLNKDRVVGNYVDSKVTAISGTSISLESNVPVGENEVKTFTQTFTQIDPRVIVYNGVQRLTLSDIKVGDHVGVSFRADEKTRANTEASHPAGISGDGQVVVLIAKNSQSYTAAIDYQKYNGKEFEQVTSCTIDPSGYCTVEQYFKEYVY